MPLSSIQRLNFEICTSVNLCNLSTSTLKYPLHLFEVVASVCKLNLFPFAVKWGIYDKKLVHQNDEKVLSLINMKLEINAGCKNVNSPKLSFKQTLPVLNCQDTT